MRGGPATRFRELIRDRLLPGLHTLGFEPLPGTLAVAAADGVFWMLDLDIASWSNPKCVTFAVSWGVYVPGVHAALGEVDPVHPSIDTCAVQGRLGQRNVRLDPTWFVLKSQPWPLSSVADAAVAKHVLTRVQNEAVPTFELLGKPAALHD